MFCIRYKCCNLMQCLQLIQPKIVSVDGLTMFSPSKILSLMSPILGLWSSSHL